MGDFEGNFQIISHAIKKASGNKCDIIVFPELALTGYPPEDLLLKSSFLKTNEKYLERIRKLSDSLVIICGTVKKNTGLFNAAYVFSDKKMMLTCDKQNLSACYAFDEKKYFKKGAGSVSFSINDCKIGLCHYEDLCCNKSLADTQASLFQTDFVIVVSASPYYIGKPSKTAQMLSGIAAASNSFILYVNLAGGQDELVFDGNSILTGRQENIITRGTPFEEDLFFYELDFEEDRFFKSENIKSVNQNTELLKINKNFNSSFKKKSENEKKDFFAKDKSANETKKDAVCKATDTDYRNLVTCDEEEIFKALVLGTRDYLYKNGFTKAVLGLSGGVDSAICAIIAVYALGSENVTGILMPSLFSSRSSIKDSLELATNLKIRHIEIPIVKIYNSYLDALKESFSTEDINLTKENIQARIRGNILMAFSNEFGWFVLTTGNKSETSVGYSTLYGDMAGGLSPIKDVYKTMVYRLCDFINKKFNNLIPENTLLKAPSAELRPNQKDQDSLPSYDLLDAVIKSYLEDNLDYEEITAITGFDQKLVKQVIRLIDINEYKRRQGPPGIRITESSVKKDRKFPMTNKFKN